MSSNPRIRVAVLRGGPSHEYEASLRSGNRVLSILRSMPDKYEPVDVFVSRDGEWHYWGLVRSPERALKQVDVVWNSLRGPYGEDGTVQELLEDIGIPFTGSGKVASKLSYEKPEAKKQYFLNGLKTPHSEVFTKETLTGDKLFDVFRNFLHPVIVKPANLSSRLGVKKAYSFKELEEVIKDTFEYSPQVLVEEFIRGRSVSCPVLECARDEDIYAFMPIELCDDGYGLANGISKESKEEIEKAAKLAHEALDLRHYSVSDFISTLSGKIYILETNTVPHMHEDALIHKSFEAGGWQEKDFVDHVIELAMKSRMKKNRSAEDFF